MQAYEVPFELDRSAAPHYRLVNVGAETVRAVTAMLHGRGVILAAPPANLAPGETLHLPIYGRDLALRSSLTVRWIAPDAGEYLWRVVF